MLISTNVRLQQMQLYPQKRKNNCSIANVATLSFCQLESWSFQWQFSPQFRGCPWAFKSRLVDGTKEFEWSSAKFRACIIPKNERIFDCHYCNNVFCANYVWYKSTLTFGACVSPLNERITLWLPLLRQCFLCQLKFIYAEKATKFCEIMYDPKIHWHFKHV